MRRWTAWEGLRMAFIVGMFVLVLCLAFMSKGERVEPKIEPPPKPTIVDGFEWPHPAEFGRCSLCGRRIEPNEPRVPVKEHTICLNCWEKTSDVEKKTILDIERNSPIP